MSFTEEQVAALTAKLDPSHVSKRTQGGMQLSYIEAWHAIAEANRIFGHDAWSRETVETTCVWQGERMTKNGAKPAASYTARVRVSVWTDHYWIVREGTGAGSGFGTDFGEAHESAVKEAESDAMKRALMTFGNPFGLALYDKTQANVGKEPPKATAPKAAKPSEAFLECVNALWSALGVEADNAPWETLEGFGVDDAVLGLGDLEKASEAVLAGKTYAGLSEAEQKRLQTGLDRMTRILREKRDMGAAGA